MAAIPRQDNPAQMGPRLRLIRLAYSRLQGRERDISQAEFARLCGIAGPTWNNAETGDNRIGVDGAISVYQRTGAPLNYIFLGETRHLPHDLAKEIEKLQAEDTAKSA